MLSLHTGVVLVDPANAEIAEALGLHVRPAPIGGSACVLRNFSITQCDAVRKLAGIRPVADDPCQP